MLIFAAALCSPGHAQATQDVRDLFEAAVAHLGAASSFRMSIEQSGARYPLALTFDGVTMIPATLNSADAQFISPNELYIQVSAHMLFTLNMDVYSLDDRQWISFPSGAPWFMLPAFEGFDVNRLMADDDGIQRVADNLRDLRIVEDDEHEGWHLQAVADGEDVSGLLFGFIAPQAGVELDFWLDAAGRFARIEMLMLETLADDPDEPSRWTIAFSDFDAPREFEPPV